MTTVIYAYTGYIKIKSMAATTTKAHTDRLNCIFVVEIKPYYTYYSRYIYKCYINCQ